MRLSLSSRAIGLVLACAVLPACPKPAEPAPPVTRFATSGEVDPEVTELVNSYIELALARPSDAGRRRDLALAYEANALYAEALSEWKNALQLSPDEFVWHYHYARCIDQNREPQQALEILTEIVRDHPSLAAAQHHYGVLLLDQGRFEEAREPFRVARALTPRIPFPVGGLAEVEFNLDNYAEAERLAREALQLDATYRRAHFVLGKALRAQGRREEAERELKLGTEASVGYVPSPLTKQRRGMERGFTRRMSEAEKLISAGQSAKAIEILTEVVRLYPEELPARVNLAVAHTHLARPGKAKEILLEVIEMEPDHFGAHINLAAAEIDLGQILEAMQHVNKAIEVAPDIGRGYLVKAQIYTEMGNKQAAYEMLLVAQRLDTSDPQMQIKLGKAASVLGQPERALEHYRKAADLSPENVMVQLNIAKLCILLQDSDGANAAYRRAREIDASHRMVKDFEEWWREVSTDGGKR